MSMTGTYAHLVGQEVESGDWSWRSDRALLYAVGVGAGLQDPLNELQFTTENTPGLPQRVLPTFLMLMSPGGSWIPRLGFGEGGNSPVGMVHGEQSVSLARPIPPSGTVHFSRVLIDVHDNVTSPNSTGNAEGGLQTHLNLPAPSMPPLAPPAGMAWILSSSTDGKQLLALSGTTQKVLAMIA